MPCCHLIRQHFCVGIAAIISVVPLIWVELNRLHLAGYLLSSINPPGLRVSTFARHIAAMSDVHKIDHEMREHNGHNVVGNGAELSRQVTVQLSSEQYERLFFQPSAPRRGDFSKRFGKYLATSESGN